MPTHALLALLAQGESSRIKLPSNNLTPTQVGTKNAVRLYTIDKIGQKFQFRIKTGFFTLFRTLCMHLVRSPISLFLQPGGGQGSGYLRKEDWWDLFPFLFIIPKAKSRKISR